MSGVWKFKPNGVVELVENPPGAVISKKLVHVATNEVMSSYDELGQKLRELGWERYYDDPELLQFHKSGKIDLISLPKDFSRFRTVHMYDIVVKNRHSFQVRDL